MTKRANKAKNGETNAKCLYGLNILYPFWEIALEKLQKFKKKY